MPPLSYVSTLFDDVINHLLRPQICIFRPGQVPVSVSWVNSLPGIQTDYRLVTSKDSIAGPDFIIAYYASPMYVHTRSLATTQWPQIWILMCLPTSGPSISS